MASVNVNQSFLSKKKLREVDQYYFSSEELREKCEAFERKVKKKE